MKTAMHKEELQIYKERLTKQRDGLIARLKENEVPEDFGNDVDDNSSIEANEAEQYQNQLSINETLRARLNEVDEAIASIKKGAYGACTSCGGSIEAAVLDAAPESRLCMSCKHKKA